METTRNVAQRESPAGSLKLAGREMSAASAKGRRNPIWRWRAVVAALIVSDLALGLLTWRAAAVFQGIAGQGELSGVAVAAVVPVITVWVGLRALLGLYPGFGLDSVEELRRHTYSVFVTLAVLGVFATGFQVGDTLSRLLLTLAFTGLLILAPFVRHLTQRSVRRVGLWGKPVVILSYKGTGANIVSGLTRSWELGYDPVAVFDFRLNRAGGLLEGIDHQEALAGVADVAHARGVDTAIFAMPYTRREQLAALVSLASVRFRHVMIVPNLIGVTNSAVVARNLAGTFAVEIKYNLLSPWALRAKRLLDLSATLLGGVLVVPLLLVLAALVYLESGRPIFYKDMRMGKDGSLFACIKFRTMVPGSEELLRELLEKDAGAKKEYATYHKLRNDPRVTRVGRFLRKTSLDELPQLWNVLKGEMSLVGPRPYLPRESKEIGMTQSEILRVPPGITGPWQVTGRNQSSFDDRVQLDAYYVRDWSGWLDLVLLARTLRTVVLGKGAY